MRTLRVFIPVSLAVLTACSLLPEPEFEGPYDVPAGFVVENALPEGQAPSLIQITFDSFGRPVVSKERGHPTVLFDNDGDGVYETEKIFSDQVKYLQGMWFEGRTLYAIGNDTENEQAGLYKLEDTDGDDVADTFEKVSLFDGDMGEHGPHDIRRGPDGQPTIMLGNHSAVPDELITPLSPLRDYKESQLLERYMDARGHAVGIMAPGGTVVRLNRDQNNYTLLLGGFRNAYNHAYSWEGEMFTFDSDMEWDINLPWYREVRSVHAVPGADYGWRTGSGKFPAYYIDSLPPVDDLGRGSPVGVEFYHHWVYPEDYFNAFLQGDWARGRIVLSRFVRDGATYELGGDPFDFVYGEPLNVTDLAVGPDGFVYFTMGGRDTVGGLYRVAYRGRRSNSSWRAEEGVMAAIRQPQPLSSWGHASLLKIKASMGAAWGDELKRVALDGSAVNHDRVQALMLLQRFGPAPRADLLQTLAADANSDVRAAAIYVAGLHSSGRAKQVVEIGLRDPDPAVQRRAAEALVRMGLTADQQPFAPVEDIYALLNSPDRFVRYAGRIALERTPRDAWKDWVLNEENPLGAIAGLLALVRTSEKELDLEPVFEKGISILKQDLSAENELRILRVLHLGCLELEQGCRPTLRDQFYNIVAPRFPAADERLNREYALTMAYSGNPGAIEELLAAMPEGDKNQPLQIHYVYCLRAIKEGWTSESKMALLSWFRDAREWRGGASFPGFINRLFDSSLEFFNEEEKEMAYTAIPEFAPIDKEAAEKLLRRRGDYMSARVFARKQGVAGVSEQEIFEYMMYDPMTTKADPAKGEPIFEEACSKCHRFGDSGKDYGPDLTTIANRFTRRDMVEAVLWPSKTISDQYESYVIVTKENDLYHGMILSEDDEKILMFLPELERPLPVQKSEIKERRTSQLSSMPDGLLDGYEMRDIANLFAYLQQGPNLTSRARE